MQGIEISPASEHDIENAFSPEDLQPVDGLNLSIEDDSMEIRRTAEVYLDQIGCGEQVNPILLTQFSVNIARSRQSDMYITESGETMAQISLGYISQASSLWGQITGAIKKGRGFDDEDDHRFSAGSDR